MEITNILGMIFGGGGALAGFFAWIGNRRMAAAQASQAEEQAKQTAAQADGTVTDYVGKIIDQADKRVQQYEEDAKNWRDKITETEAYAKEQRIAVNTLRGKLMDEQKARHKAELALKDAEAKLAEANHYRCEANGWCDGRIPPRPRTKVKTDNQ